MYKLSKSSTKSNKTFEKFYNVKQRIFNVKQCSTRNVVREMSVCCSIL